MCPPPNIQLCPPPPLSQSCSAVPVVLLSACSRALLNSEIAKQGYFCTPISFLAKQEKIHQNLFFSPSETGYIYLRLLRTAEYSYKHQITIGVNSASGILLRWFRVFFKYSWKGKKAKKKESKKKNSRNWNKKKKKKKKREKEKSWLLRVGFEPTTHTPGSWAKFVRF